VGEEALITGDFPGVSANMNKITLGDFVTQIGQDKEHAGVFDLKLAKLVAAVGGTDPEKIEEEMGDLLDSDELFKFIEKKSQGVKKPKPRVDDTIYDL
jgi:hypothetical protein